MNFRYCYFFGFENISSLHKDNDNIENDNEMHFDK